MEVFWLQKMPVPIGNPMSSCSLIESLWFLVPILPMPQLQQINLIILIERIIEDCGKAVITLKEQLQLLFLQSPSNRECCSFSTLLNMLNAPELSFHFSLSYGKKTLNKQNLKPNQSKKTQQNNSSPSSLRQNNCVSYTALLILKLF